MPPFLPRKRLASDDPESPRPGHSAKRTKIGDSLDAPSRNAPSLQAIKDFSLGGDDSDSSLSDVDSEDLDEFEDVPSKTTRPMQTAQDDEEHENEDWEDAIQETKTGEAPRTIGDLELKFKKGVDEEQDYSFGAAPSAKKGPTRREKEVRILTHKLHVQFLLYHNAVRNGWICDKEVQDVLVKQLPAQITEAVEKWRRASGLESAAPATQQSSSKSKSRKGKNRKNEDERTQRDWGQPSQRLEPGRPDLSRGDPLIPLIKALASYWRKRFVVNAPGLRKRGYGTKVALQQEIASYRNDEHDLARHGERIRNIKEFRVLAKKCEGSRDLGAQLFTALLRGLGIESRLVSNLQPTGFGWTKADQAMPRKPTRPVQDSSSDDEESDELVQKPSKSKKTVAKTPNSSLRSRGNKKTPIDLDSDNDMKLESADDESVVDVTTSMPKQRPSKFDRDLPYPVYWAEAISPISHQVFPVSPSNVDHFVATTPETLLAFEPRGSKADKAKQVMAYVVAYSPDGSAKDVTTRYLKKHIWPGKTKGFRIPPEKVSIYNKRGKIKRYEAGDWFKQVMSGYVRSDKMRRPVDDVEDSGDLVPQQPDRKDRADDGGDTLQSLKSSAEFVLQRFLRREEALRHDAQPVRHFVSGKGDKQTSEPVYLREDVERCLSTESWHKEGRRPNIGAEPLKHVPIRAVTLDRKRAVEEELRQTGEKPTQPLYSEEQTEDIIPDPLGPDRKVPKNAYGNMDAFKPHMVPEGAVHLPYRGMVRICKKLEIDFAEAVTGFEFGNKRAVPVITGVVVAEENEDMVLEAWREWNTEQKKKEEGKLEKAVLALWRRFVMGLRINERVQEAYGEEIDGEQVDEAEQGTKERPVDLDGEVEEVADSDAGMEDGGGFLLPHEDETRGSDLVLEHEVPGKTHKKALSQEKAAQYPTPMSMPSARQTGKRKSLLAESAESSELSDGASAAKGGRFVQSKAEVFAVEDEPLPATKRRGRPPKQKQVLPRGLDGTLSSTDEMDDSGDDFKPEAKPKERSRPAKQKAVPVTVQKTTPKRRTTRKSALTSPYFDGSDED